MLSVIVPTRNERENVVALLARTLEALDALDEEAELVVVDGASEDGTPEAVREASVAQDATDRVRVIDMPADRGLSAAVLEGVRQARGDVLAVMDADLSHPPESLGALLAPLRDEGVAMVVGSRRVAGGGVRDWPWRRRLASRLAALLARPLVPVRDTTSGFFAIRRELLEGVTLRPIGYKIALEILVRARPRPVREVGFLFQDRTRGQSKLGLRVAFAYLRQLAGLYGVSLLRVVGLCRGR